VSGLEHVSQKLVRLTQQPRPLLDDWQAWLGQIYLYRNLTDTKRVHDILSRSGRHPMSCTPAVLVRL